MPSKKSKKSVFKNDVSLKGWQLLIFIFGFAILGTVTVLQTLAAPGGGKGEGRPPRGSTSTLRLVLLNSTDGLAHYGQKLTYEVSTTATTRPSVSTQCYQAGRLVYTASAGFYPEWPWGKEFTLSSQAWTSGEADCTARLYSTNADGTRTTTLTTQNFHVFYP